MGKNSSMSMQTYSLLPIPFGRHGVKEYSFCRFEQTTGWSALMTAVTTCFNDDTWKLFLFPYGSIHYTTTTTLLTRSVLLMGQYTHICTAKTNRVRRPHAWLTLSFINPLLFVGFIEWSRSYYYCMSIDPGVGLSETNGMTWWQTKGWERKDGKAGGVWNVYMWDFFSIDTCTFSMFS